MDATDEQKRALQRQNTTDINYEYVDQISVFYTFSKVDKDEDEDEDEEHDDAAFRSSSESIPQLTDPLSSLSSSSSSPSFSHHTHGSSSSSSSRAEPSRTKASSGLLHLSSSGDDGGAMYRKLMKALKESVSQSLELRKSLYAIYAEPELAKLRHYFHNAEYVKAFAKEIQRKSPLDPFQIIRSSSPLFNLSP